MTLKIGDKIKFKNAELPVEPCKHCGSAMINVNANQIFPGDLMILKTAGVRISNPETDEAVCLNCDIQQRPSKRKSLLKWFDSSSSSDSGWFSGGSSGGSSSSGGGFNFGGFGGGGFSGGGASGSW